MELAFESRELNYLKNTLSRTGIREESMEFVVPDSSPDVERILFSDGQAMMNRRELASGNAVVSGGVLAHVLYAAGEEEAPRCMEVYIPYHIKEECREEGFLLFDQRLLRTEARIVNSRKLLVRIELGYTLRVYTPQQEQLPQVTRCPASVELHCEEYSMLLPADTGETAVLLSEEREQEPGTLCGCYAMPRITEKRLAGDKAVFKGELCLTMLCLNEEELPYLRELKLPFSQYCQLGQTYEEAPLEILPVLTRLELEPENEDGESRVQITAELTVQALIYRRETLELCDDAYSLSGALEPQWQELPLENLLDRVQLRGSAQTAEDCNAAKLLCSQIHMGFPQAERRQGGALFRAPVCGQVVYLDEEKKLQGLQLRAQCEADADMAENVVCRAFNDFAEPPAVQNTGSSLELRCTAQFEVWAGAEKTYRTMAQAELSEEPVPRRRPMVIAKRLKGDTRLWDLAKANGTTVEQIRRANGLEGDVAVAQTVLLIPRG